jgi:hypothetical protein
VPTRYVLRIEDSARLTPAQAAMISRDVADPGERYGAPVRTPTYRLRLALKALLRSYGLRCVQVTDGDAAIIAPRHSTEPSRN